MTVPQAETFPSRQRASVRSCQGLFSMGMRPRPFFLCPVLTDRTPGIVLVASEGEERCSQEEIPLNRLLLWDSDVSVLSVCAEKHGLHGSWAGTCASAVTLVLSLVEVRPVDLQTGALGSSVDHEREAYHDGRCVC